jgi:hypothetical protein
VDECCAHLERRAVCTWAPGRNRFLDFGGNVALNSEGRNCIDGNEVAQNSDTSFTIKEARIDFN